MMTRLNVPLQRERIRKEEEDPPVVTWENQWSGTSGNTGVFLFSVLNKDLKKYEGKSLDEASIYFCLHRFGGGGGRWTIVESKPHPCALGTFPRI